MNQPRPALAATGSVTLSTSFQGTALGQVQAEGFSEALPAGRRLFLGRLEVSLQNAVAGQQITMYLSHDSAGTEPITDTASSGSTRTVTISPSDATKGGVSWDLAVSPLVVRSGVYVWLKTSSGTPAAVARLFSGVVE